MELIAVIGTVAAMIAAGFEIYRWLRDRIALEITWRFDVQGTEVESLGVHRGLVSLMPRFTTTSFGLPIPIPDFPCPTGYLIVTLTKRSKGPLQLRDIYLEMNTTEGPKLHGLPHTTQMTLGLNDPHRFFAPNDKIDLSDASIIVETDRDTFRKPITGK